MKLLIVTYFFPPSGGGGVHRPLKFAEHLPRLGIETHVLAPSNPRWIRADDELPSPAGAHVHRASYLGPATRLRSEQVEGQDGLRRAGTELSRLPSRLLLPDQHVTWNLTAIPAAIRIARDVGVDAVLTSSPPSSLHLVGAAVKRVTGARWIADLRDPMSAHPHRRLDRVTVRVKERSELSAARLVARYADAIVAASKGIARQIGRLAPAGRVETIPNGCDFEDFRGLAYRPGERFRITHAGLFFGARSPRVFLSALAGSGLDVDARFVGGLRPADRRWAHDLGLDGRLDVRDYVPHRQALQLQRDSEALLLLIAPAGGRGNAVLSAKLFEYLAAGRPILAAVPPEGEAAALVRETGAGIVAAADDVASVGDALAELHARWHSGVLEGPRLGSGQRERLSRRTRVAELADLLRSLT